jgi:ABC-type Fe3+/spermidine/putrescine transport system ATPase subunit
VAHLATRRARRLSGGEASRVALARAFATEPALLLLDEPLTALDAPTRATLLPVLRKFLRETGTAAVFVTHDLAEAFAFGDQLALMQAGRIVARGEASALIARPPSRDVAELLGIENILTAQVIRSEGEAALVSFLPDGPPVWVETSADAAYQPGQIVTFTVPAAAARALHPGDEFPPGSTCLSGPVVTSMPFPSGTRLVVQTPALVAAHAPWDHLHRNWVIGERAVIAIPRSAGHLVPDDP